jgi:hypothetical protein
MPRNFADKSAWNAATGRLNATSVAIPGETNSLFQNLGLPCPPEYGSQDDVGKRFVMTENDLVPLSSSQYANSANAKLYGGIYQLVLLDSGATAANVAPGTGAYLLDTATGGAAGSGALNYSVTSADQAISVQHLCGVFLYAATVGQYTWIQVHGKCPVQYIATVTATTAGSTVIVSGTAGKFDAPTQSGSPTFAQMGTILGNAISTPANGALGTVFMRNLQGRY